MSKGGEIVRPLAGELSTDVWPVSPGWRGSDVNLRPVSNPMRHFQLQVRPLQFRKGDQNHCDVVMFMRDGVTQFA